MGTFVLLMRHGFESDSRLLRRLARRSRRKLRAGVTRLFCRHDLFAMCEVPLPNGRRADLMAIGPQGRTRPSSRSRSAGPTCSATSKWTDYLEYCDRFFWAVPPGAGLDLDEARFLPDDAGLLVADRYDAAVMREASTRPLAPARRKAETLRFARRAARRLSAQIDPSLGDRQSS